VLVWRVGAPVRLNLRHQLRVASVVDEGAGIWSVRLTGRRLDRLRVEPGQFFSWRFLGRSGWTRANPYSLSAAPDGRSLRITVQGVGDGSRASRALTPGARALVEGPFGRLSARARTRPKVALIGAGVGITPLRALAEGFEYTPGEAIILQRYTAEPLFMRELESLSAEKGLQVVRLPGPRRTPASVLGPAAHGVPELLALRRWIPDIADRDVFLCGPSAWTDGVAGLMLAAGVPHDRIHSESFGW